MEPKILGKAVTLCCKVYSWHTGSSTVSPWSPQFKGRLMTSDMKDLRAVTGWWYQFPGRPRAICVPSRHCHPELSLKEAWGSRLTGDVTDMNPMRPKRAAAGLNSPHWPGLSNGLIQSKAASCAKRGRAGGRDIVFILCLPTGAIVFNFAKLA